MKTRTLAHDYTLESPTTHILHDETENREYCSSLSWLLPDMPTRLILSVCPRPAQELLEVRSKLLSRFSVPQPAQYLCGCVRAALRDGSSTSITQQSVDRLLSGW